MSKGHPPFSFLHSPSSIAPSSIPSCVSTPISFPESFPSTEALGASCWDSAFGFELVSLHPGSSAQPSLHVTARGLSCKPRFGVPFMTSPWVIGEHCPWSTATHFPSYLSAHTHSSTANGGHPHSARLHLPLQVLLTFLVSKSMVIHQHSDAYSTHTQVFH